MCVEYFQKEVVLMTKTEGTMSSSTTLHIQDPPQYDVTIENENNLQQSIFLDMYHGAARNVDAIIERNKKREFLFI